MENEIKESCELCKFFKYNDETDNIGICRRYPRAIIVDVDDDDREYEYPELEETDWCGEFKLVKLHTEEIASS